MSRVFSIRLFFTKNRVFWHFSADLLISCMEGVELEKNFVLTKYTEDSYVSQKIIFWTVPPSIGSVEGPEVKKVQKNR